MTNRARPVAFAAPCRAERGDETGGVMREDNVENSTVALHQGSWRHGGVSPQKRWGMLRTVPPMTLPQRSSSGGDDERVSYVCWQKPWPLSRKRLLNV